MDAPYAVIDLGTNTFHLLIARVDASGTIHPVIRKRFYVRLARNTIQKISSAAIHSGLAACRFFKSMLDKHKPVVISVIGTEALRKAENGLSILHEIEHILDTKVEVITGPEEAALIAKGARHLIKKPLGYTLITDIGGGSVEFIIDKDNTQTWIGSFPVGVAVMKNQFHRRGQMLAHNIALMEQYLDETLQPLAQQLKDGPGIHLIGAAGVFEILSSLQSRRKEYSLTELDVNILRGYYQDMVAGRSMSTRSAFHIPHSRVAFFPVAIVLIHWLITRLPVHSIYACPFAMKEGKLLQMAGF